MDVITSLPEELIYQLLYSTDGYDVVQLCQSHSRINQLCNNPIFWRTKIDLISQGRGTALTNISLYQLKELYLAISRSGSLHLYTKPGWSLVEEKGIVQIACGEDHIIYLNNQGEVYSWGANSLGQLGLGDYVYRQQPEKITGLSGTKIKQIACGSNHTALLTDRGEVYMCGYDSQGELGLGKSGPVTIPLMISNFNGIKQVGCGYRHTVFLTDTGKVYTTGRGMTGQLGLDGEAYQVSIPTLVTGMKKIKYLACGTNHTLLVAKSGELYGFGSSYYGQIGTGQLKKNIYQPTKIELPTDPWGMVPQVSQVACGSFHSLIRTNTGDIYTMGRNNVGQLGLKDKEPQTSPLRINIPEKVSLIAAGFDNSGYVTSSGQLFIYGELPSQQFKIPETVKQFAFGNERAAVIY